MEQNEINEGNKLIARFMGWEEVGVTFNVPNAYPVSNSDHYGYIGTQYPHLEFFYRWDWLMLVIERIENYAQVTIKGNECRIDGHDVDQLYCAETKIEAAYLGLVHYIGFLDALKEYAGSQSESDILPV